MKKRLFNVLIAVLVFLPATLFAQDITGVWTGELYNDSSQQTLQYQIAVSGTNGKFTAYSYTVFEFDGRKQIGVKKLKLTRKKDEVILVDADLIDNDYSQSPPKGVKQVSLLKLSVSDSVMTLQGKWGTNRTKQYAPLSGNLIVKKRSAYNKTELFKKLSDLDIAKTLSFSKPEDIVQKDIAKVIPEKKVAPVLKDTVKIIAAKTKKPKTETPVRVKQVRTETKEEPKIVQAAADVKNRKTSSMRSVFFDSDSLQLTLYDNGEIDGDTVSVLLNGKVIIARQGLTLKPNVKIIYITKEMPDSLLVEMYAENLGSIPPNSGLLVVHDGEKTYEVPFSADLSTNAAIMFRRKKN